MSRTGMSASPFGGYRGSKTADGAGKEAGSRNTLKAGEVETLHGGKLQFPQAAAEMRVQYPAGSPADQSAWGPRPAAPSPKRRTT